MIRHIAVFRWRDDATPAQVAEITAALDALPDQVPSIRRYEHGPDLRLGSPRWDYAVVAEFEDEDGWRAYDTDPAHAAVRSDLIVPLAAERTSVQVAIG